MLHIDGLAHSQGGGKAGPDQTAGEAACIRGPGGALTAIQRNQPGVLIGISTLPQLRRCDGDGWISFCFPIRVTANAKVGTRLSRAMTEKMQNLRAGVFHGIQQTAFVGDQFGRDPGKVRGLNGAEEIFFTSEHGDLDRERVRRLQMFFYGVTNMVPLRFGRCPG